MSCLLHYYYILLCFPPYARQLIQMSFLNCIIENDHFMFWLLIYFCVCVICPNLLFFLSPLAPQSYIMCTTWALMLMFPLSLSTSTFTHTQRENQDKKYFSLKIRIEEKKSFITFHLHAISSHVSKVMPFGGFSRAGWSWDMSWWENELISIFRMEWDSFFFIDEDEVWKRENKQNQPTKHSQRFTRTHTRALTQCTQTHTHRQ